MATGPKLIIGLGNPGKEYEETRHNVGFLVLDALASSWGLHFGREKWKGLFVEHFVDGHKVILLKPQTFMNLSGECIQPWIHFLKVPNENILVIHDELDLALGRFKAQWAAGAAGHRGVRSMIEKLGHQDFNRLRIGVGHPGQARAVSNYVLSDFAKEEAETKAKIIDLGQQAILTFIKMGLDQVSQMLNKALQPPKSKDLPKS